MSYSIYIVGQMCEKCGHQDGFLWDSLTSNLNEMMVAAFGGIGLHRFKGWKASDVAPELERALRDMRERPDYYRGFDSHNGWGNFDGVCKETSIPYLVERFLEACKRMPDGIVYIR